MARRPPPPSVGVPLSAVAPPLRTRAERGVRTAGSAVSSASSRRWNGAQTTPRARAAAPAMPSARSAASATTTTIDPALLMEQLAAATPPNAGTDHEALDVTAQRLLEDLIQDAMTEEENVENEHGLQNTMAAAGPSAAAATAAAPAAVAVKHEADMDEEEEEEEEDDEEQEEVVEEVDEDDEEVVVDLEALRRLGSPVTPVLMLAPAPPAVRPGRPMLPPTPADPLSSADEDDGSRQYRNRIAARRSRQRQKDHILALEDEVRRGRQGRRELQDRVDELQSLTGSLHTEIGALRRELEILRAAERASAMRLRKRPEDEDEVMMAIDGGFESVAVVPTVSPGREAADSGSATTASSSSSSSGDSTPAKAASASDATAAAATASGPRSTSQTPAFGGAAAPGRVPIMALATAVITMVWLLYTFGTASVATPPLPLPKPSLEDIMRANPSLPWVREAAIEIPTSSAPRFGYRADRPPVVPADSEAPSWTEGGESPNVAPWTPSSVWADVDPAATAKDNVDAMEAAMDDVASTAHAGGAIMDDDDDDDSYEGDGGEPSSAGAQRAAAAWWSSPFVMPVRLDAHAGPWPGQALAAGLYYPALLAAFVALMHSDKKAKAPGLAPGPWFLPIA